MLTVVTVRKYEQRLRAENAEETRRRILDAFAERLRQAPTEPVSLDQVAKHARVARSTIYTAFGSRAGLFDAFVDDLWARTGVGSLTAAVGNPDARLHLHGGIRAATRMYANDLAIYRALFSLGHLDPDAVGGALKKMEAERAGGMAYVAHRLHEDGRLRPDVTVDQAADMLWVLCSFEAFDALYTTRGLSLEASIRLLITMAERSLLADPADG
jgi:AcrR family transcriptional regulator